jgi:hypothetical protein
MPVAGMPVTGRSEELRQGARPFAEGSDRGGRF